MGNDAGIRLVLALALSVALHLSLMFGIAVGPPMSASAPAIVARLAPKPSITPQGAKEESPLRAAARAFGEMQKREPIESLRGPEPEIQASPAQIDESLLPRADVPLLMDPVWYAATELDAYPRPLAAVESIYPESAVDLSGEVSLLLKIDEFGAVQETRVVNADPAGYFEDSAARAFTAVRFSPARRNGHPVRSQIVVKMRFAPQQQASAVH